MKARVSRAYQNFPIPKELRTIQRNIASRFFQLYTNHAHLGAYLHRIGKAETDRCLDCHTEKGTARHSLFFCRVWRKERRQLFKDLQSAGIKNFSRTEESIKNILRHRKAVPAFLTFLGSTKIALKPNSGKDLDSWDIERIDS